MANVIVRFCGVTILLIVAVVGSATGQTALERQLDSLFVIASSAEIQYQDLRDPAMDEIAAFGAEAVPFLVEKFTTRSSWERWTVIWILQRIGSPAVPDLLRALRRPDGLVVQSVCWALGDIKDSSAVDGLMAVCDHPRWQVRDQAVGALGKIGHRKASAIVRQALQDTIGQVRKSAVVSCGQLETDEAVAELVHALGDDFYGARLMAVNTLLQLDTSLVLSVLADSLNSENQTVGDLACQVLGEIGSDDAMELLLTQTSSPDPDRRAHTAVALVKADPLDNCGFRRNYFDRETDRLVRLKIEAALSSLENEE